MKILAIQSERVPRALAMERTRVRKAFGEEVVFLTQETGITRVDDALPMADLVVFLGGSRSPNEDNVADCWLSQLMRSCLDVKVTTLAICLAHQIACHRLFSAGLKRKTPFVGPRVVELTDTGRAESWLGAFGSGRVRLIATHEWHVTQGPNGASVLGTSPQCEVEIVKLDERFVSIQGHPEFGISDLFEIIRAGIASGDVFIEQANATRFLSVPDEGNSLRSDGQALIKAFMRNMPRSS